MQNKVAHLQAEIFEVKMLQKNDDFKRSPFTDKPLEIPNDRVWDEEMCYDYINHVSEALGLGWKVLVAKISCHYSKKDINEADLSDEIKSQMLKIAEKPMLLHSRSWLYYSEALGLRCSLETVAKIIEDNTPENFKAYVDWTYEDFGAGTVWKTIIVDYGKGHSYQALYPRWFAEILSPNGVPISTINELIESAKGFDRVY